MTRTEFTQQNPQLAQQQIEWQKQRQFIFANMGDDILDFTEYWTPIGQPNIYTEYQENLQTVSRILEKLDFATKQAISKQSAVDWRIALEHCQKFTDTFVI